MHIVLDALVQSNVINETSNERRFIVSRKLGHRGKKKIRQNTGKLTLLCGKTIKAPPPADSTMMAKNLGFTVQNVESHDDLDTLILS
jgi:hypothetical protein